MNPDQSDGANATMSDPEGANTLARAQAKAAELPEPDPYPGSNPHDLNMRRCLFGHSVPANQGGYETKAGWVCTAHSSSFDND